ncbi:MAG: arylesterase [Gammaproteobacteria bacterium]|nr:arylesterase [Gammaproteobacteria bacterium]MDP2142383.1 arylesterase [Gammaproteobacteria bacterium]MDP2348624.1 arylesterase [Gammaproteobacteria bacterium]
MSAKFRNHIATILLFLSSALLFSVVATGQEERPVILVFGDSLSAAYRMDEADGWVTLLGEKIKEEGLPFRVVNASVSGETTDGGLARLPAALSTHNPAFVILELGGNDGLRGLPVSHIRQNLTQMATLSREAGARVVLAGIQIPPNYGPRYTAPFASQYGEIAAEMDLPLIPFLIDGIPQQPELMQDDGIHPRAEAQSMILDNVWPVLESLLKEEMAAES